MVTDLVQIRRLGESKRDENMRFRLYLKRHNYVERKMKKLAEEVQDQIDCTTCANCCRVATVAPTARDSEKLARFLGIGVEQFEREYTERDAEGGTNLKRIETGCVFLDGYACTVYEARPRSCELFPHAAKGDGPITARMWELVDRATYCPIAYNSMEAFKAEMKFGR